MSKFNTIAPTLYFSYSSFAVYDQAVPLSGLDWKEAHVGQGFARRDSVVNFGALLEFGHAFVLVRNAAYEPRSYYERVIAVPFLVTSGRVQIDGPEEYPIDRGVDLTPGNYRLIAAQYVIHDVDLEGEEGIDLFFEPLAARLERSEILIADDELNPTYPLLETASIAGED
jgi:hypothetical protein